MRRDTLTGWFKSNAILWIVLGIGLVNGLVFAFLVPPWQHYDEPGNFEFAWLIANRSGLPSPGDYDQSMRRELAASMMENDFFRKIDFRPNLLSIDEPVWIGISQITDKPLHYWLAALPLRLVRFTEITFQLYVTRLISLFFYLLILAVAYAVACEITQPGHPLRWVLPLTMALMPGFTDMMTAVNDDVGATLFFSLFFWAGVRTIQRGFSVGRLLSLLVTSLACYWTKTTVAFAPLLLPIPLFFTLPTGIRRKAWPAVAVVGCFTLFLIFDWTNPAHWLISRSAALPVRVPSQSAPFGQHVFQLTRNVPFPPLKVLQILTRQDLKTLRGRRVTIGAWMWGDRPGLAYSPELDDGVKTKRIPVSITTKPTFHSFTVKIDPAAIMVRIQIVPTPDEANPTGKVYYDGVVLIPGDFDDIPGTPLFEDDSLHSGVWNGNVVVNLIQNPSAEQAWPGFRSTFDTVLGSTTPIPPSMIVSSLFDLPSTLPYFQTTATVLFTTFWGKFGWGDVRIMGEYTFMLIALLVMAGFIGAGQLAWRKRREIPIGLIVLIIASLASIWGVTVLRGIPYLSGLEIYFPRARYAYPAIIPTMLILCAGWIEIIRFLQRRLMIQKNLGWVLYCTGFLFLDLLAIASLLRHYHLT